MRAVLFKKMPCDGSFLAPKRPNNIYKPRNWKALAHTNQYAQLQRRIMMNRMTRRERGGEEKEVVVIKRWQTRRRRRKTNT
jgi:hypothetical protein